MATEKDVKKENELKDVSDKTKEDSSKITVKPSMKDGSTQTDSKDDSIEIKNMEVLEKCTIQELIGDKFITSLKGFRYAFNNKSFKKNDIIRVGIDNNKDVVLLDKSRVIE